MGQANFASGTPPKYFYTRDHLGSSRELTDSAGAIKTRYGFDPYGVVTETFVSGSVSADMQYAGYYAHARSGLNMPVYRAYNAGLGRFISRDPIAERGGINLYGYVRNMSTIFSDPLGLKFWVTGDDQMNSDFQTLQKEMPSVMDFLENSDRNIFIMQDIEGGTAPSTTEFSGGAIMIHLGHDSSEGNRRRKCPSKINLAHEIGHALGIVLGVQSPEDPNYDPPSHRGSTPDWEKYSMLLENFSRTMSGLPYEEYNPPRQIRLKVTP